MSLCRLHDGFGRRAGATVSMVWGFSWGVLGPATLAGWLELGCGMGWGACWSRLRRLARVPGTFQSAASVLESRVGKCVCAPFKSRVLVSYSPLALLVIVLLVFKIP